MRVWLAGVLLVLAMTGGLQADRIVMAVGQGEAGQDWEAVSGQAGRLAGETPLEKALAMECGPVQVLTAEYLEMLICTDQSWERGRQQETEPCTTEVELIELRFYDSGQAMLQVASR